MTDQPLNDAANQDVELAIQNCLDCTKIEDRIEKILDFMQSLITDGKTEPLSKFWKLRLFFLEEFKQDLKLPKRFQYWTQYQELVTQIIQLKDKRDDKVLENKEKIEKTLSDIEETFNQLEVAAQKLPALQIIEPAPTLEKNKSFYQKTQTELNLITRDAKQLNSLKKEVVSLKVSHEEKQQLFDTIHALSDQIFPKKRELLAAISKVYADDVSYFIRSNFEKKELKMPLFNLKEQIKSLQAFAKEISLNVGVFSQTREKLSECWNQIRTFENDKRKEKEEQKEVFKENEHKLNQQINVLKKEKANLSKQAFDKKAKELEQSIKSQDLLKSQKKKLTESVAVLKADSSSEKETSNEEENFIQIQREILKIKEKGQDWDYFTLAEEYRKVFDLYHTTPILDTHHSKVLRRLFSVKVLLLEKLLEEVENTSDIENLSSQIEAFRKEMREDIEGYRKALNASNQSIEKAMLYNELLTQTKAKLSLFDKKIKPLISS